MSVAPKNTPKKAGREITSPQLFDDLRDAQDLADVMESKGNVVSYRKIGALHEISWQPFPDSEEARAYRSRYGCRAQDFIAETVEFDPNRHAGTAGYRGPRERLDLAAAADEQRAFPMFFVALGIGMVSGFVWREIVRFVARALGW